jgi:hypothetical protein
MRAENMGSVMQRYTLIDAQARADESPRTFYRFPLDAVWLIKVGDHLGIGVDFDPACPVGATNDSPLRDVFETRVGAPPGTIRGERFWVLVKSIGDDGTFEATVDNNLVYTPWHGLRLGDTISFEARHILKWEPAR